MKQLFRHSLILILGLLTGHAAAQCPSELLFLKAPDTICSTAKELVLTTSKARESNVRYVWRLPNQDSIVTTDTVLIIRNPQAIHSGNYSVFTTNGVCASAPVGPLRVTIFGVATLTDTVKHIRLCGAKETILTSKFKTSPTTTGKWYYTEGVEVEQKEREMTRVKNLAVGENVLIWVVSTNKCLAFAKDSFIVSVEIAPRMDNQTFELQARSASLTLPLGTVGGSNLNAVGEISIKITQQPRNGTVSFLDKNLKYTRKTGFNGTDQFSLSVCNKRCPNLCSPPVSFQIQVEYDDQYPNVTIPKLLSPHQMVNIGWLIENVDNYPENELLILNRWGSLIKKIDNYTNATAWDGTDNGKLLPSGAYYFSFQAKRDNATPPRTDFKALTGIFYIID
jgi:gliding motility-associated-like protein